MSELSSEAKVFNYSVTVEAGSSIISVSSIIIDDCVSLVGSSSNLAGLRDSITGSYFVEEYIFCLVLASRILFL